MMQVREFFDRDSFTLSYVVWNAATRDAIIIDPVLDYDPASSRIRETSVSGLVAFLKGERLVVHYILETHPHADHLSASQILKRYFPHAKTAIGARVTEVQEIFKPIFDLPDSFATDGRQFDLLLNDGQLLSAGKLEVQVRFTPGHTPACSSYQIEDAVFTGDSLFMPDYGVGRCDFPAGSAESLYDSITQRLYRLPDATRVFTGHDYLPNGRPLRFESTIGEEKASNIQLNQKTSRETFIKFRAERDKTLSTPRLLFPSVQINIDGGHLPPVKANGRRYLRLPLEIERATPDRA